jgi:hypothetical protein
MVESPPVPVSLAVDESPPLLLPLESPVEGESSSVVLSGPASSGILLRSKSTRSSHPGIAAATATVAAAITRPHFIERFVLIDVLVVKAMCA